MVPAHNGRCHRHPGDCVPADAKRCRGLNPHTAYTTAGRLLLNPATVGDNVDCIVVVPSPVAIAVATGTPGVAVAQTRFASIGSLRTDADVHCRSGA